jgi:hypothetical protein
MTLRGMLMSLWALVFCAGLVHAQPAATDGVYASRGSLTILSKPAGAVFTLEGAQIQLSGRTPWSVTRGLSGPFTIRAQNRGYEGWSRTMFIDPTASDTLRIELSRKTAFKAFARSLVVPGWGQVYGDQGFKGAVFFTATVASGVFLLILENDYQDARDRAEVAFDAYVAEDDLSLKGELRDELDRRIEKADDADRNRDIAAIVTASIYGANLIDTLFFFPEVNEGFLAQAAAEEGWFAAATPRDAIVGFRWTFE